MSDTSSTERPAELDERLVRRDTSPLPAGAVVRVQSISRGKSPAGNLRYYVTGDGAVFESGHSGDTSDWQTPFDQPWPGQPTRSIDAAAVGELNRVLQRDFAAEESYQADQTVEDGAFVVITARISGSRLHEVIYDAILSPVARDILRITGG
jgi:hypothetical protein